MKTANFQQKMDSVIKFLFLWAIPRKITPNMVSYLRLGLIPFLFWALLSERLVLGLAIFVFAALTDALDGTMARTRDQITDLGKALDPVADKALIGSMLVYFGFEYLIVKIFLVFIVLEIIVVIGSSMLSYKFGRPIGANVFGKVKMVLQTLSVLLFIIGVALGSKALIGISEYVLFVALGFAAIAGLEVLRQKWPKIKNALKDI